MLSRSTKASGFDNTGLITDDSIENILQIPSLDFFFGNEWSRSAAVLDFQIPTTPQVNVGEIANV